MHWSLPLDPTPEDRLIRNKWARGVAIVYGSVLLLLLGIIVAHRYLAEPKGATGIANIPAGQVSKRPPAADQDADAPTASIAPIDLRSR